jgi:hypothetical protein
MKKLLIIIIAMLYISTSTGAVIHMHFCMGKLSDWGLWHNDSDNCSKCGMEKNSSQNNKCCKDEQKYIKNTADQKVRETNLQFIQILSSALPVPFIETTFKEFSSVTEENPRTNAPPLINSVLLYIRNCTFRI